MFNNIETNLLLGQIAWRKWKRSLWSVNLLPHKNSSPSLLSLLLWEPRWDTAAVCTFISGVNMKDQARAKLRANELKVSQWNLAVTRRFLTTRAVMLWDSLLGKEKAPRNLCWFNAEPGCLCESFPAPQPFFLPLLARPEVGELSAASRSLLITLGPCKGAISPGWHLGADSYRRVSERLGAWGAGARRLPCQQFILPVGPVFFSPILTASCTK